ncbi:MAG TPA: anti-sigma regulatory factor [Bacillota bacterium]|nr:anti-sigma regulatory factor [Bacillota bacterium]
MNVTRQSTILINNEWDIIIARQQGRRLANKIGFSIVDQARITTVISELARNIYLYTSGGEIILYKATRANRQKGLQIKAIDHGPGIDDIQLVLQDGFSTTNSLGAGLPGVKRMVDEFDMRSSKEKGTVIHVCKWLTNE